MAKAKCGKCDLAIADCKDHYTVLNLRYVETGEANEIRAAAAIAGKPMVTFVVDTVLDRIRKAAAVA